MQICALLRVIGATWSSALKQGLPQLQVCSQSSVLLLPWKLGVPRAAHGWKVGDFQLCVCAGEGQEEAVRVNVSKERMLE